MRYSYQMKLLFLHAIEIFFESLLKIGHHEEKSSSKSNQWTSRNGKIFWSGRSCFGRMIVMDLGRMRRIF